MKGRINLHQASKRMLPGESGVSARDREVTMSASSLLYWKLKSLRMRLSQCVKDEKKQTVRHLTTARNY